MQFNCMKMYDFNKIKHECPPLNYQWGLNRLYENIQMLLYKYELANNLQFLGGNLV